MPEPYNWAEMRDHIRRAKLNITPPVDIDPEQYTVGVQPLNRADPSNPQINAAISEAVKAVNRKCGFAGTGRVVETASIAAQTADGIHWLSWTDAMVGTRGDGALSR